MFRLMISVILFACLGLGAMASEPIFRATGIYAESARAKAHATKENGEDSLKAELQRAELPLPDIKPPVVSRETFSAYSPWYEIIDGVKHHTSEAHLIQEHGAKPELVKSLTQAERDRLHGKLHGELPTAPHSTATTFTTKTLPTVIRSATPLAAPPGAAPPGFVRGNCPGGFCPTSSTPMRRGRRR